MEENITFRIAARCEAAGRPDNEDNYQICDNLDDNRWGFTTDQEVTLSSRGALLVVADGMGGLNAGEEASAIAVETVKKYFAADRLGDDRLSSPDAIRKYIMEVICAADRAIKREGAADKSKRGMGSTIVLAWLTGRRIYVGWCGDSRAYRFNPAVGLERISHDHSYVQELVDAGKLQPELAFNHPDSNIITRSLGDPGRKAASDVLDFPLCNGDVFLLCSDGLSGVLCDGDIGRAISGNLQSLEAVREALWDTSCEAGWNDNVTIALCQVLSGGEEASPLAAAESAVKRFDTTTLPLWLPVRKKLPPVMRRMLILLLAAILGALSAIFLWEKGGVRKHIIHDTGKVYQERIMEE
ncbi:MAG: protein phosphatase 2C domain-containing protein [Tannerella sp.]|jgi:serine/threonine protein phosphatase PrpC|nr:protein phosphatase 2C domain-containing protein [Tannerella sp.]